MGMNLKPIIWIIDTSVFTNILDVPGKNQNRPEVIAQLKDRLANNDTLLMPFVAIIETGNHIAQVKQGDRYAIAEKFVREVMNALEGKTPWKPMKFPEHENVKAWLASFPRSAGKGIGFGDFSIIKEWEQQRDFFKAYSVRIWSIDADLQGYIS